MQTFIEDHFLGEVVKNNKSVGKSPYPSEVLIAF